MHFTLSLQLLPPRSRTSRKWLKRRRRPSGYRINRAKSRMTRMMTTINSRTSAPPTTLTFSRSWLRIEAAPLDASRFLADAFEGRNKLSLYSGNKEHTLRIFPLKIRDACKKRKKGSSRIRLENCFLFPLLRDDLRL